MKTLRTAVAVLLVCWLAAVPDMRPARADEGLDAIAAAVGVTQQATDYVVIVDTSASMRQEGRWARAREAVSGLLTNLTPDDHVTLITFDDGAKTAFTGVDPAPATVLAALPAQPAGRQTDIGAAIDLGVRALARDGAREVAALVLLTDGELDAAGSSKYASPDAPAWAELRNRAATVTQGRQVGAFALSLGPESDAGLLTKVFPSAEVATPSDIVAYLTGLNDELTRLRVAEALAPDLAGPVTVAVEDATTTGGTVTATARFTSTAEYLPVTVSSVALEPPVPGATVGLRPGTVELAPGAEATALVTVELPPGTDMSANLVATLTSPWQAELAELGLGQPLTATSAPIELVAVDIATASPSASPARSEPAQEPPAESGVVAALRPWVVPAAVAAAALLLVLWALKAVAKRRGPRLDGSLAVMADGDVVDEFIVTGPEAKVTRGDLQLTVQRLKDGTVQLKGRHGKEKFTAQLVDGQRTPVAEGVALRYTDQRTRMLDMITDDYQTTDEVTGP